MSEKNLIVYEAKRKVARITLNRPPIHAFNLNLFKRLYESLLKAETDDKVKCLLIKSIGIKLFSAGFDTKIQPGSSKPDYLV